MVPTDEAIKESLITALARDDQIDVSKLRIDVQNASVTLSGEVPTASVQAKANWITTALPEVTDVINHLTVRRPATLTMPTDEKLDYDHTSHNE